MSSFIAKPPLAGQATSTVEASKVRLTDDGKRLSVHGSIGVPMLGRSQTWVRQE
ncbi:MAG: hypothetical protein WB586_28215 [Chthoniobacterales bacterium]